MIYNDNIELVKLGIKRERLAADEYYALMVVDYKVASLNGVTFTGDDRKFFDGPSGRLGLEQTGGQIYISKNFRARTNADRGELWLVRVKNPALCVILS
jgi:hypothetical protein